MTWALILLASSLPVSDQIRVQQLWKALSEDVPACVAAWNAWVTKTAVDVHVLDAKDRERFRKAKKACGKAFKSLEQSGYR